MDQTKDTHYMTREFLESRLIENEARIKQLEEHIQTVTQRSYGEAAERNRMRNEMQEWTLEALENGTFDEGTAEEIANICGFELTQEFELEVTIQYSITVNAANEEAAQNIIHDIDFDSVSYPEQVTYLSSMVDQIEI
jgi:hypothetical protein